MMTKWFIIIGLMIPLMLQAQKLEDLVEKDPEPVIKKQRGLAYSLVETGSGLGGFYEVPMDNILPFLHVGAAFDILLIRDKTQFEYYDPYYGYISIGKNNNVFLLDLMVTAKYRLFPYDFADQFRPFITAGAGPVFGMNFPETATDVPLKNQYLWAPGALIGFGIDAGDEGKTYFGFRFQYRFMPFSEKLGERQDHSMVDIRLELGQRF
ncbi:MAG TPA: hypothetical protein ENJ10_08595 [Caldithrix abyssi]|uniref:Outer membrane protein beta-barrel domain-containing protein n=1 Tax=Caldithrix abyssi TaxID=187145 RepID=A0A7V1LMH6_CALAY|nr:hypothetical protein [Caldithrix abyssi]